MNLDSAVFHCFFFPASFLLIRKSCCQWLNLTFNLKQHESLFQQSVITVFISLFINLLLTSPSFIRIQSKTLKLVFAISYIYKAFVQFSSHAIELILKQFLNYSAEENPCLIFFPGAFSIKLVGSFILVWHSYYELLSKTQKPSFILKESNEYQNINYRAKNHVVRFCFGLQSIARLINTNASYFNTHWLESEGKFSSNFWISVGKNENVIHVPRSVRIGRNCALSLSTALGLRSWAVLKTSGTVSPNTDRPRQVNNFFVIFPAGE